MKHTSAYQHASASFEQPRPNTTASHRQTMGSLTAMTFRMRMCGTLSFPCTNVTWRACCKNSSCFPCSVANFVTNLLSKLGNGVPQNPTHCLALYCCKRWYVPSSFIRLLEVENKRCGDKYKRYKHGYAYIVMYNFLLALNFLFLQIFDILPSLIKYC
jgi:hypothetical protein